jgi:hypothetical protein
MLDVCTFRVAIVGSAIALTIACGGGNSSPSAPSSPSPSETRIMALEGDLNFGDVDVNTSSEKVIRIVNRGTATMTVTSLNAQGSDAFGASWTNGSIASNQWQDITIRFSPTAERSYSTTLTVLANQTSGTNTMAITARGVIRGPRTQFGAGTHLVNTDIAPGRYFDDPADGCYWERLSGLGGTLSEIISNEFISFNAGQWIVDIAGSDRAFKSDSECGTWFNSPRSGPPANTITPGVWLINQQIAPGTYRGTAAAGCYWARLRDFGGNVSGIIANDFVSAGGSIVVSISGGDAGFQNDGDCGTWTRVSSLGAPAASVRSGDIADNLQRRRQRHGIDHKPPACGIHSPRLTVLLALA